ncbi:hypothetical protein CAPTEDRAFT_89411 [Capitella teleta]|uniref:DOMON domain-containing protein n=1 Tax=Capitella teleta TaxID=283909 RepID=R7VHV2_CAPTE|nr:hypothetical protein CAPTEDRAFT_89411 [Capitella teleta]|eukprot:ELU18433.1 hypothetical protein CAPTEDRAFT_89411 [Capitella teleta]
MITLYVLGFEMIDFGSCGTQKGCFRFDRENSACPNDYCEYGATYRVENQNVHFELTSLSDWVAIGFSSDDRMGGDDIVICKRMHGGGHVGHYFSQGYMPPIERSNGAISDTQVRYEDGRITCRFSRALKVNIDNTYVDFNNDWYQLYAWGPVSDGGAIMQHYLDNTPASHRKLVLSHRRNEIRNRATHLQLSATLVPFTLLLSSLLPLQSMYLF